MNYKSIKYFLLFQGMYIVSFYPTPVPDFRVFFQLGQAALSGASVLLLWICIRRDLRGGMIPKVLLSLALVMVLLIEFTIAGMRGFSPMCTEDEPNYLSWSDCSTSFIIINESCIPDGAEGGVIYTRKSFLPFMSEVVRESNNYWYGERDIRREGSSFSVGRKYENSIVVYGSCK